MAIDREKKIAIARGVAFVVLLVGLAIAAWAFGWGDYLFGEGALDRLGALVSENYLLAVVIYIASVVIGGVLLAVPGFVFALAAGVLFGPWWGTLICAIAGTISAMIAFVAGRTILKDIVEPIARRNRYIEKWLFNDADRDAVIVLLITRMVPVIPYNLQNFAYGVTDIKFSTYSLGTFAFMIPGTAAYTFAAAGIVDESQRVLYLAVAAVLALLAIVVGVVLYRRNMAQ